MKKYLLSICLFIVTAIVFGGCVKDPQVSQIKKECQYKPHMTSKQIEQKLNWKYCEESF